MKSNSLVRHGIVWLILAGLLLSACAPVGGAPSSGTGNQSAPVTVRVAVIPVLDTLPMYVAQKEGLFKQHGVEVQFIPVKSAPERDQIISAGQAEAMVNEVLSTIFYNKDKTQVQIVRFARTATADSPLFRILASKQSGITTVEGLKGVPVGISQGTVIDYLTHRLLQAEGFTPDQIQTVAVPDITARMALLSSGELKAGMLPSPLSDLAIQQGAAMVLDDTAHPEYSFSVIAFRKAFIDQHPETVRAFLAAIEEATTKINADPVKWNSLLTEQQLVPAPLVGSFQVPPFVTAGVPSEAQWNDVLAWAKEAGLVKQDVSYSESVTGAYLPKN